MLRNRKIWDKLQWDKLQSYHSYVNQHENQETRKNHFSRTCKCKLILCLVKRNLNGHTAVINDISTEKVRSI